jgi:hypothetical protein
MFLQFREEGAIVRSDDVRMNDDGAIKTVAMCTSMLCGYVVFLFFSLISYLG